MFLLTEGSTGKNGQTQEIIYIIRSASLSEPARPSAKRRSVELVHGRFCPMGSLGFDLQWALTRGGFGGVLTTGS